MARKKLVDVPKLCQEYREGRSLRDLAQDYGCSHVFVWRALLEAGEPIRTTTSARTQALPKTKQRLHHIHAAHAVLLHSNGVPVDEIAFSLRHTPAWVKSKLAEAGIQAGE